MSDVPTNKIKAVSVSLEEEFLTEIDRRAKAKDMSRSQYFRFLARQDLAAEKAASSKEPLAA